MEDLIVCAKCSSENGYFDGTAYMCPDCNFEWTDKDDSMSEIGTKDSNGTNLNDGDDVVLIKDLKVKGSSITLKRGAKARSIRLTDNPEEVDCKIEGMAIVLKTCFLKKV